MHVVPSRVTASDMIVQVDRAYELQPGVLLRLGDANTYASGHCVYGEITSLESGEDSQTQSCTLRILFGKPSLSLQHAEIIDEETGWADLPALRNEEEAELPLFLPDNGELDLQHLGALTLVSGNLQREGFLALFSLLELIQTQMPVVILDPLGVSGDSLHHIQHCHLGEDVHLSLHRYGLGQFIDDVLSHLPNSLQQAAGTLLTASLPAETDFVALHNLIPEKEPTEALRELSRREKERENAETTASAAKDEYRQTHESAAVARMLRTVLTPLQEQGIFAESPEEIGRWEQLTESENQSPLVIDLSGLSDPWKGRAYRALWHELEENLPPGGLLVLLYPETFILPDLKNTAPHSRESFLLNRLSGQYPHPAHALMVVSEPHSSFYGPHGQLFQENDRRKRLSVSGLSGNQALQTPAIQNRLWHIGHGHFHLQGDLTCGLRLRLQFPSGDEDLYWDDDSEMELPESQAPEATTATLSPQKQDVRPVPPPQPPKPAPNHGASVDEMLGQAKHSATTAPRYSETASATPAGETPAESASPDIRLSSHELSERGQTTFSIEDENRAAAYHSERPEHLVVQELPEPAEPSAYSPLAEASADPADQSPVPSEGVEAPSLYERSMPDEETSDLEASPAPLPHWDDTDEPPTEPLEEGDEEEEDEFRFDYPEMLPEPSEESSFYSESASPTTVSETLASSPMSESALAENDMIEAKPDTEDYEPAFSGLSTELAPENDGDRHEEVETEADTPEPTEATMHPVFPPNEEHTADLPTEPDGLETLDPLATEEDEGNTDSEEDLDLEFSFEPLPGTGEEDLPLPMLNADADDSAGVLSTEAEEDHAPEFSETGTEELVQEYSQPDLAEEDTANETSEDTREDDEEEALTDNPEEDWSEEEEESPEDLFETGHHALADESAEEEEPLHAEDEEAFAPQAFAVGDRVHHETYGAGLVERIIPMEGRTVLNIQFENVGKRLMDPALSDLEKIKT